MNFTDQTSAGSGSVPPLLSSVPPVPRAISPRPAVANKAPHSWPVRRIFKTAGVVLLAAVGILLITRIGLQIARRDTPEDYTFLCATLFGDLPIEGTPTLKPSDAEIQAHVSEVDNRLWRISWRDRNLAPISRNNSLLIQQAETLQRNAPRLSPIIFGSAQAMLGMYWARRASWAKAGKKRSTVRKTW